MSDVLNPNLGGVLSAFKGGKVSNVINAIQNASSNTGVDFSYLVQQAKAESSLDPAAKAKTSSASGLFQFIESTWMGMVNRHGEKYGIDSQSMSRSDLLKLRFDPEIASNMAAELAAENKNHLERNWGGKIGPTELYFAHFMGAGGATAFLKAKDENPVQVAANLFPKAAKANYNVFYDAKSGRARSLAEVYDFFDKKFQTTNEPVAMPQPPKPNSSLFQQDFYQNPQNSVIRKRSVNPLPLYNLVTSPVELMILAEMDTPFFGDEKESKSKLF
ncbi:MAG: transglycosylase SLT domain-containing protein [Alphaproteobacteria bacterium]